MCTPAPCRILDCRRLNYGLEGTMPSTGWVLPSQLTAFELRFSSVTGTIPSNWDLPDGLQGESARHPM